MVYTVRKGLGFVEGYLVAMVDGVVSCFLVGLLCDQNYLESGDVPNTRDALRPWFFMSRIPLCPGYGLVLSFALRLGFLGSI